MIILEEQIIMTTMTMMTTATITKTKTVTGTTIIEYQTMMKIVLNHMMILTMVTNPRIIMKIIFTQKMRKMMTIIVLNLKMMIILLNLKMMIKIQMMSINMKNLQVEKEEETDIVFIDPYPAPMAD